MITKAQIESMTDDPKALRETALGVLERYHAREREHESREREHAAQARAIETERERLITERDAAADRALKAEQELALTLHKLKLHLGARFGPRIEKLDANQLALFAKEIRESEASAAESSVVIPAHSRSARRGGRAPIPAHLPREEVIHSLPGEAQRCPCCEEPRVVIATEVREVIEIVPAQVKVIRHLRPVYACPSCPGQIAKAPAPALPLGKSYAGASLLALVAVSKFADHAPLYRQEGMLARSGLDLSRSTLCGWLAEGAELIAPLVALMKSEVLRGKVIQTDDTPVPTLGLEKGRAKEGRMWVYLGDDTHRHAVFEYTKSREGKWPQKWLEEFKGSLQSDAFAGYAPLHLPGRGIVEVACWAHARRKFHESRELAPGFCLQVLTRIAQLYAVEAEAREHDLDFRARAALRAQKSRAPLEALLEFLESKRAEHLPKSPVRGAIEYVLSRRAAFMRYLDDGTLEIDNNACERALRCVAIGRKNWLFAGSAFGGERAAKWFTLIASARLAEVEPWAWLKDVLTRLSRLRDERPPAEALESALRALLPENWLAHHPQARLPLGR